MRFMQQATIGAVVIGGLIGLAPSASAGGSTVEPITDYEFAGPVFGVNPGRDGSVLVADAGAGVVIVAEDGTAELFAELPGVADVIKAPGRGYWAVTGEGENPGDGTRLYRINKRGKVTEVADLGAYERANNSDGGLQEDGVTPELDSNPLDLARQGNQVFVADAAANAILRVNPSGRINLVAVLPTQVVSTADIKDLVGCGGEDAPPDLCGLPPRIPAQPVATSVAIGPDGRVYASELKGFPAPLDKSRVWSIPRRGRGLDCGTSPKCRVAADGFTSIIDINFDRTGALLVTELDESSWFAVEVLGGGAGGTINRCDLTTGACAELFTEIAIPTATFAAAGGLIGSQVALDPATVVIVAYPAS